MRVYCLFGDQRVTNSKSPLMHNRAFEKRNLDAKYVSFGIQPDALGGAIAGFRELGFHGANVTIPHKENVVGFMDDLTPTAAKLGAVNTIIHREGKLIGENTDVGGFCDAISSLDCTPDNRNCLVIGTGGAARGLVMALGSLGASTVFVTGRNIIKARKITQDIGAQLLEIRHISGLSQPLSVIVNATSVSAPEEADETITEIAFSLKAQEPELIFDINYGRSKNIWENCAKRTGCKFSDGLAMLAGQAARSFNLWTGECASLTEFLTYLDR